MVLSLFHLPRCILLLEDLDAAFTRGICRDSTSTGTPTAPTKAAAESNDGSTLSLSGLLNSLDGVAAAEGRYVCVPIAPFVSPNRLFCHLRQSSIRDDESHRAP